MGELFFDIQKLPPPKLKMNLQKYLFLKYLFLKEDWMRIYKVQSLQKKQKGKGKLEKNSFWEYIYTSVSTLLVNVNLSATQVIYP